jgi:hypothetical protein
LLLQIALVRATGLVVCSSCGYLILGPRPSTLDTRGILRANRRMREWVPVSQKHKNVQRIERTQCQSIRAISYIDKHELPVSRCPSRLPCFRGKHSGRVCTPVRSKPYCLSSGRMMNPPISPHATGRQPCSIFVSKPPKPAIPRWGTRFFRCSVPLVKDHCSP